MFRQCFFKTFFLSVLLSQENKEDTIILLKGSFKYGPELENEYSSFASFLAEQAIVSV